MSDDDVRYPEVVVRLVGEDGDSVAIIGRVRKALRRAGVTQEQIEEFTQEATSGDYDNVLRTCMRWVNVE